MRNGRYFLFPFTWGPNRILSHGRFSKNLKENVRERKYKEKAKEKKKKDLKLINYFYIFLQTHFT